MVKKTVVRPGYVQSTDTTLKVPVSQLGVGMYVSALDRPWLETPFLVQGFLIESLDHIMLVQEFCDYVYIDAVKEDWVPAEERVEQNTGKKKQRYIHKVSVEQENGVAPGVYRQAKTIVKSVLDDVRIGNALDVKKAKETVSDCVDSLLRNPDALMWLGKINNVNSGTAEHSLNVCILVVAFGRHLGLEKLELEQLGLCGLLHDIGMMKVPGDVLSKGSQLSEKETRILKGHTLHGRNILMSNPGLYHGVTDVAHCHHEHLDGSGYPRGLKAVGISHNTRMVSIVDTYIDMTTEQFGGKPSTTLEAVRFLYANRGTKFDDELVLQFVQCVGLYPPGSLALLNNGEVGIVISTNYKNRRLPKVLKLLDHAKNPIKPHVVNLGNANEQGDRKEFLIKDILINGSYGIDLQEHLRKGLTLG
ncbi:hypothetical protein A9Q99_21810 [Gammaproteobacteria bacterium 45_16_T64]|nr:hypothetical protein A9Q99_21810 [Gammaproteobacteria bacterium 45_16_T64]